MNIEKKQKKCYSEVTKEAKRMLQRVMERIAFFLVEKELVANEDIEWCVYLLQKWLLNIGVFIILFVIGCCLQSPLEVLLYLSNLWILRRGGGYHAQTPISCLILSIAVELLGFTIVSLTDKFMTIFTIWGFVILWFIYPSKQGVSEYEFKQNKQYLRIIILLEVFIEFVVFAFLKINVYEECNYWNLGVIVTAVFFIVSKHQRKEEEK